MNYVEYGAGDLMEQLQEAWEQLQPLYLQLHAYVRRKLREVRERERGGRGRVPV
ncbi:hypothetical protein E2C01_086733 [Portunus trituberculatus]|uniref:Angiotensin-converting enzyme n=1 Tax=Portunus trituberculatus TaxID=210409 RepID=A0A5B7JA36_PORTR|nr:hypothetical protein [Portunus trituberculatus]